MQISIKTNSKDQATNLIIKEAFAYFTRIKAPQNTWKDKDKPLSANPEREYKTTLLVDKDVAKVWNKAFKKSKSESMDADEAVARLKLDSASDLPFEAEEYFVITLKQSEKTKVTDENGKEKIVKRTGKKRPQVVHKGEVITFKTLVGAGSKVTVTGTASTNPSYGTFPYLDKMLVTDLVEVEGSGVNAEVFGDLDFDSVEEVAETDESVEDSGEDFEEEPPFELDDEDDF